ncbi:MAG: ATP-binding cassette domain-containing protein [Oscillospiraceae bacterium]|nr:ATP-binding cassette domain-containing protein [Oscillospiraceae bacterium]
MFQTKNSTVRAVDDVSFDIRQGEIFGIIGMSGAGKSTLVRMLNRLEEATDGEVIFDGKNLGNLSNKQLRTIRMSMAMIFQSFNLLMQKTVLANVMLPMKIAHVPHKEQKERALQMLKVVGLEDKASAWPAQLSGGQRQRVAIARALAMNPKVLLCDEATSSLDPKITEEILALLKDINQKLNLTIVIITHEMSVVEKICDRVAIISDGKLAEIGEVKEVFTSPKTEAARHLILPVEKELNLFDTTDRRCIRIVFDGRAASDPLIANLVADTGVKVNILCADTKTVGGVGFGQMIVELPKDEDAANLVINYIKEKGVNFHEIERKGDKI